MNDASHSSVLLTGLPLAYRESRTRTKSWENEMIRCIFIGKYGWTWVFAACASLGIKLMNLSEFLVGMTAACLNLNWQICVSIPVLYSSTT